MPGAPHAVTEGRGHGICTMDPEESDDEVEQMENTPHGTTRPTSDIGAQAREDFHMMREAAQKHGSDFIEGWRSFVEEHPFAAVGAAFGIGFALSGGLMSRATFKIGSLVARLYGRRFIGELLARGFGQVMETEEEAR